MQRPTDFRDVRAVLFDLDGTLTDTFELWYRSVNELLARHGAGQLTVHEYRTRWWGMDGRTKVRKLLGAGPDEVEQLYGQLVALLMDKVSLVKPLPGARETVAQVRAFVPVGVISNGPRTFLTAQLRQVGMDGWFAVEIADAEPKPSPAGILQACHQLGLEPAQAVFVGDSSFDQRAASAAGTRFIRVREGVPRYEALAPLLEALRNRGRAGNMGR